MKRSDVLQIVAVLWFIAASLQSTGSGEAVACMALFALCGILSLVHLFWLERGVQKP